MKSRRPPLNTSGSRTRTRAETVTTGSETDTNISPDAGLDSPADDLLEAPLTYATNGAPASEYVSDFQAKCGVSRQAAIDAVYRMFEAVLPADREDE